MYLEDWEWFLAMTFNIIKNVYDYHHDLDYDHYFDLDQDHDHDQKGYSKLCLVPFYKASIQHLILLKVHIDIFAKFHIFIFLTKKNYDLGLKLLCLHIRASEESRPEIFRFKFYIFQIFFFYFSDLVLLLGGCISQQKCRPEKRMIACYSAFLLPSQLHTFPCWVNRWVTATLEFWHKEWL